jgi:hypothetical protein
MEIDRSKILNQIAELGFSYEQESDNQYRIQGFYFTKAQQHALLWFDNEALRIRRFSGQWVKISCVEDLIGENFYNFYLKELEKSQLEIPKFWLDLYNGFGYLDKNKEQFKEARVKAILERITEHCSLEEGIKDKTLWNDIAQEFPECIYHGPGYRAILVDDGGLNPAEVEKPGYSWALSLDGIENFVKHGDRYSRKEDPGFYLVQGLIKGISIVHILKFFDKTRPYYEKEDEVILLEMIQIEKTEFIDSYRDLVKLTLS